MENLDRGIIAVRTGNSFNLYRNGTKVNSAPLKVTKYTDNEAPANATYSVRAILNNVEQPSSEPADTWAQQYLQIPLQVPQSGTTPAGEDYSYSSNDCSIEDLDGDGKWEIIIVKWEPSNSKDADQAVTCRAQNSNMGYIKMPIMSEKMYCQECVL